MNRQIIKSGVLGSALLGLALAGAAAQAAQYQLGPADSLTIDQPRVTFGLVDESTSPNPTLIGPNLFNSALLDTGANGVLLAAPSYNQGEDYGQPLFDGSPAQYAELGVAGTSLLDVHDPWSLRILDSDGVERIVRSDVRAFGDPSLNIGSFGAIVGMPAMQGFVVEVDMRPTLDLEFQHVAFHDQIGQASFESAASLNVDLRMLAPEHTDTTLPEALRPTFAALPLVDHTRMRHAGGANSPGGTLQTSNKSFLVDTGAQTTIISEQMATDLGIDFTRSAGLGGDVVDSLQVGGIGGLVDMPLVNVDQFVLPVQGGDEIAYDNLLVGVLDIDGAPFDAVLGMNLLTTGYLGSAFGLGPQANAIINPIYALEEDTNNDVFQVLIDSEQVTTVDDLFEDVGGLGPVLTLTREEYDILVDSQLLPDTDDPEQAFEAVLALEGELSIGSDFADEPVFDKVVFDFTATDGTGVMRLDFANDLVVPEPGTMTLLGLAGLWVASRRRRR